MSRLTDRNPEAVCPTCAAGGQMGCCARLRCYCGHKECWAFDSYFKPSPVTITTTLAPDKRVANSWAERDEPTWLDR